MAYPPCRRRMRTAVIGCVLVVAVGGAAGGAVPEARADARVTVDGQAGFDGQAGPDRLGPDRLSPESTDRLRPDRLSLDGVSLDRLMGRIETTQPWAKVARSKINEYYVDRRRGVVAVGVAEPTPQLRRLVRHTFGDAVRLYRALPSYRAVPSYRAARDSDHVPYAAGALIQTPLGVCTSGFGVVRARLRYFLSAGHCFRGPGDIVTNDGRPYGRVSGRRMTDNGPDTALVASAFAPRMYVGGPDSDRSVPVAGRRSPGFGAWLCTSGARSGEDCSGQRRETGLCVRFGDGVTTCHLTRVVSSDGRRLVEPGDSGGPVYLPGGYAVGITVGGNRDGTQLLYHPIGYLLDVWDARLLTGSSNPVEDLG